MQDPEPQQDGMRGPDADADNRQEGNTTDGQDVQDNVQADDVTDPLVPPPPPPGPSAVTVAYNFVTSFFTSLFPSGPGVQN